MTNNTIKQSVRTVFGNNWTVPYVATVSIKEALTWELHNQTLEEALYYYAVNFANCPEWMKDYHNRRGIMINLTDFVIYIESKTVEFKTEFYEDSWRAGERFIRINETSPWICMKNATL